MTGGGSIQQLRENFEAQFEAGSDGRYLYRRNQKGEPIPVSADERDRFVRQYIRRIWYIMGGMMVTLVAFVGFVVWWSIATHEFSNVLLYIACGAIASVFIGLMYWVRGAPARELEGRASVGRERTKEEMRAIFFGKLSYAQLAGAGAFGLFITVSRAIRSDTSPSGREFWFALGAGLVLLCGIQAFRKWRFEQEHPDDLI
jgi:hypothetical protein